MNDSSHARDLFEREVTRALERKPTVRLSADFAARVAAQAASLPTPLAKPAVSYGRRTALVCAAVLLVATFVLAANAKASFISLAFDLELLLLLHLVAIACWLTFLPAAQDV